MSIKQVHCLLFFTGFLNVSELIAQGSLVVMPMSAHSLSRTKQISFTVHNMLDSEMKIKINPKCDVDSKEYEGEKCFEFFQVGINVEGASPSEELAIPARGRLYGTIRATDAIKSFGIYKPVIDPVIKQDATKKGISFIFNYQPGYLFLLSSEDKKLGLPEAEIVSSEENQLIRFRFNLNDFVLPRVMSISAKIMNKETKKLIRFLRLADNSIIDPRRKVYKTEGVFAKAKEFASEKVCYKVFVQDNSDGKKIYTLDSCK